MRAIGNKSDVVLPHASVPKCYCDTRKEPSKEPRTASITIVSQLLASDLQGFVYSLPRWYLEGLRDVISRFIIVITRVTT